MYSVSACSAADDHDQISCLWIIEAFVLVYQADVAAIDQRISQVSIVEINCTVDRWYSHSVAIVANTGHDALHNSSGVQNSFGDVLEFLVGLAEAKYIRVGDWSCAHAGRHWVANHTSDTRGRPAVRVECRGMIVRFDFETYC